MKSTGRYLADRFLDNAGGAAIGYGSGAALSNWFIPDVPNASYEERRRRDRLRTLAKVLGMYSGAIGGMSGMAKPPARIAETASGVPAGLQGLVDKFRKK